MKTDAIFYEIIKELPNILFELIGQPNINSNAYEFIAPELKQTSLRLDGVVSTRQEFSNEPLYFVETQFYKDEEFYDRLDFVALVGTREKRNAFLVWLRRLGK